MAGLTDEELSALEAESGGLSDDQLAAKENANRTKPLNPTMGEHLADTVRRLREQLPNKLRSAAMGFTNNLGSRVESFVDAVSQDPNEQAGWVYDNSDQIHAKYMKDVREQPGSNVAGAMLQPNPLGKVSAATKLGKAALVAGRISQAGAGGAMSKYLDGEPEQQEGTLPTEALAPMAVQAGAELISPAVGKLSKGLRTAAGSTAANAAGLRGGIVNQAKRAGINVLDASGEAEIPKIGNKMLDEGLIPFGGSKMAVLRRSEKMMDQAGNAQEALLAQGDMVRKFDPTAGASRAEGRLAERIDPALGGNLQTARASKPAKDFISDAQATPGTFKAANDLKKGAYGSTNWSTEAADAPKLKRQAVSGWRESIEDQLDAAVPGAGARLKDVNSKYGLAAQTADFAEEAAGREAATSKFGPMQMLLATAGAGAGAPLGAGGMAAGASLPLLAHFAKTRGAATAAPLLRIGSRVSGFAGRNVNQSPAAASPLADYLKPMSEEEREEKASKAFAKGTGR